MPLRTHQSNSFLLRKNGSCLKERQAPDSKLRLNSLRSNFLSFCSFEQDLG